METKYMFSFTKDTFNTDMRRLVNQVWKLIPMRENQEDWETHLNIILEEIAGLHELFADQVNYLIILSKLEGLRSPVCKDFMLYRKTVFRCIDLLGKLTHDES